MAVRELNLFVDLDEGKLVQGFTSTIQATLPRFAFGDLIPISVRVLQRDNNDISRPWKEADLAGKNIRLAIGSPGSTPRAGDFTLTFGEDTTTAIPYNATDVQLAAALNALATITSAGGVTVTKSSTGIFRIVFNNVGDAVEITADTSSLYPTTGAFIAEAVTGDPDTREVVVLSLQVQPAAYVLLNEDLPVADSTVTIVREGATGIGEIQTLSFDPEPYDGTYTLTISGENTATIAHNALAEELQTAIEAIETYTGKVVVSGVFPRYTITFDPSLSAVGAIVPDLSGLIVPKGRRGQLNTNTTGIIELLNGASNASATLEIEIIDNLDSTVWTAVQSAVTVVDDVIPSNPASQTPLPTYLTAADLTGYVTVAENTEERPEDAGEGYSIAGTIPPAGKGLVFIAPNIGIDPCYTDTGGALSFDEGSIFPQLGSWVRACYKIALEGYWFYVYRSGDLLFGYLGGGGFATPDLVDDWVAYSNPEDAAFGETDGVPEIFSYDSNGEDGSRSGRLLKTEDGRLFVEFPGTPQRWGEIALLKSEDRPIERGDIVKSLRSLEDLYIGLTGNQAISGVKTFASSPQSTGTPSGNTDIMNRLQTDQRPFMFLRPTDSFQIRRRQDYFFRGSITTGDIGEWGWTSTIGSGGSVAYGDDLPFPTGRTLNLSTSTSDNASVSINKVSGTGVEKVSATTFYINTDFPVNAPSSIVDASAWVGWDNGSDGRVVVGWDRDVGPNFLIRMKGSLDGAETVIDTGIAVPTGATFWPPQMAITIIGDSFNSSVLGGSGFRIIIAANTNSNSLSVLYNAQHAAAGAVFGAALFAGVTTRTTALKVLRVMGVEVFHGSGLSAYQH